MTKFTVERKYRTYRMLAGEKDPVIDKVRTLLQSERLLNRLGAVHEISNVAEATLKNWFDGPTLCPQNATVAAVVTSLGYDIEFIKRGDNAFDLERERRKAADWLLKQNTPKRAPVKTAGNGKHAAKARGAQA